VDSATYPHHRILGFLDRSTTLSLLEKTMKNSVDCVLLYYNVSTRENSDTNTVYIVCYCSALSLLVDIASSGRMVD
jgi:hypothetical protein